MSDTEIPQKNQNQSAAQLLLRLASSGVAAAGAGAGVTPPVVGLSITNKTHKSNYKLQKLVQLKILLAVQ